MIKRSILLCAAVAIMIYCFIPSLSAAEETKRAVSTAGGIAATASLQKAVPAIKPINTNFEITTGKISKIDTSDPANIKLQVNSDTDNTVHIIEVLPWTSVTKMTDVSELKEGDTVRAMTRKADNKEIAMGIMFGKIRNIPRPTPIKAANQGTTPTSKK
jgi:Cu/Ag efflux protein CusF